MLSRSLASVTLLLASHASAQSAVATERLDSPVRNYVNLRVGATTSSQRPEVCLEGQPAEVLSFEACGTGSGFLHRDPAPEIAHFRTKLRLLMKETRFARFEPRVSMGFAELQVGEDSSGFHFGGTGPGGVETAGPEVGLGVRGLVPVGGGVELIGELEATGAWMPHAPRLVSPQRIFQPSLMFTLGAGF